MPMYRIPSGYRPRHPFWGGIVAALLVVATFLAIMMIFWTLFGGHRAHAAGRHHGYHHARYYHHVHRRHHRRYAHHGHYRRHAYGGRLPGLLGGPASGNLVRIKIANGQTVLVHKVLADRFKAMFDDFAAAGYKPRHVGCYASGGHVRFSRHYQGAACDIDQIGYGRTTHPFTHTRQSIAIIRKWGLRSGCDFGDCGHVDDGHVGGGMAYAKPLHPWPLTMRDAATADATPKTDETAEKAAVIKTVMKSNVRRASYHRHRRHHRRVRYDN